MCTLTPEATLDQAAGVEKHTSADDAIQHQIRRLSASRFRLTKHDGRRRFQRHPFPYLIRLLPVDKDGLSPCADPFVVVGKQLSEQGLDFYHEQPIPFRRVIASLQTGSGRWLSFLVDLTWCRFTEFGWYDSGGRFLQVVDLEETG